MTRRAEWMNQLHKWFDYWLYGVQNGIMQEPRVDIENTKDNWGTYADWPLPGSKNVDVFLQGDTATTARQARRRHGRRDRHAEVDRPLQPERDDRDEHRRGHDAEQPPRVPRAGAQDRPARVRHAAHRHPRVAGQAAVEPLGDARRLRAVDADHAHGRRHHDARERAERLLGLVVHAQGRERQRDRLRRLLPDPDQADGHGHRDPGLADLARDARLLQPRLALHRDARGRPAPSTSSSSRSCPWTTRSRPATASASC